MSRTDRPSSESYCPKIGRNLNHLGNWVFHIFEMEVESSTSDTISPMIGAAAMDSYYVLRCHRHIKFISLHSSPSKKCRFSNARMTGGRAGAPLFSSLPHSRRRLSRSSCPRVAAMHGGARLQSRFARRRPRPTRTATATECRKDKCEWLLARSLAHSRSA